MKEIQNLEYNEFLQQMRTNPAADLGTGQFFNCISGDQLFYRAWESLNPQKIVIGIHGLAGHGEYYVQVADQLITNKVSVYSLDLKHHGRSTGKKGDIKNFKELIEQINEFVLYVKTKLENIPIFLMGISMGGCIAINYALMFPATINGIILMAPAVKNHIAFRDKLKMPILGLVYLVAKGKPIIDIAKRQGAATRNPLRFKYDESDRFRVKKISLRYLFQVNKFVKKARNNTSKIFCPVLIMQGTQDNIVSFEGVKEYFNKLTLKDKKLVVLDGAYHCLYSDPAMVEGGGWESLRNWVLAR